MSLHTWCCPRSPQAKHLCHLHTQLSLGQSCHRQKKNLASICAGSLWSYPTLCNPVDCGLPGFSARGVLQARILEPILTNTGCHTLLKHFISCCPHHHLPEYLVLPEPLQPKQLHHLHTWPSQGQTQVLQGRLRSKPQWTTHMQRWK